MTSDQVMEQYYEFASEGGGDTLLPFLRHVLDPRHACAERQELLDFLDRLEIIILGNIETRYDEGPGIEADPDWVREETQRELAQARSLVLETLPE